MTALNIAFCVVLLSIHQISKGCEPDQTRQGCRIQNGFCLCGTGCYSEYRYTTREECRKALRGILGFKICTTNGIGRRTDVCQRSPCQHGGSCIQTSFEPGFRCRCEGTGYYGNSCQNGCPTSNFTPQEKESFPYECVEI